MLLTLLALIANIRRHKSIEDRFVVFPLYSTVDYNNDSIHVEDSTSSLGLNGINHKTRVLNAFTYDEENMFHPTMVFDGSLDTKM